MPHYIHRPIFQTASQLLSSAALSDTYEMLKDGFFFWAGLKADGNITETVTVEFDSLDGATYDIILKTQNLSSATDFAYIPGAPIFLRKGDKIKITCTKATATETVYSTICVQEVPTHE